MISRFVNWLKGVPTPEPHRPAQQRRRVSAHAALHARATRSPAKGHGADLAGLGGELAGPVKNAAPGKNVLQRERLVSDDTGTREMLKLLDDPPLDNSEPVGIDPYNSGQFDRSRYWDTRFRD